MHKRYRVALTAAERGVTELELIKAEIERLGSVQAAARSIGVTSSAIHRWLRIANLQVVPLRVAVVPIEMEAQP